jgi:hypothetical protein
MPMPDASVAANLNETLNVEVDLFSKLALNPVLTVNSLTKAINFVFSQVADLDIGIDTSLSQNLLTYARTNAVNILE